MNLDLPRLTAAELTLLLNNGKLTSLELVRQCHAQMLEHNAHLNAVISISPLSYTESIAKQLDEERRNGVVRSALHEIPFIVKDAMDTTDEFEVQSTNGGWAFVDSHPRETANVIAKAVKAGLILVGKANLTVCIDATSNISGGWSARGGQMQSTYVSGEVIDDEHMNTSYAFQPLTTFSNPSGSSSGSAVAVSAGFAPLSIGADFNGSLTNPAIRAALYTIRTTPGIVSEHRCFPFSKNRDSVGPMAKTPEDLIAFLDVIVDTSHPKLPRRQWKDIAIATLDPQHWHLPESVQKPQPGALDQIIRETLSAYQKIATLAKCVVGPVDLIDDETLEENVGDVMKTIKNDFAGLFADYTEGLSTPKVRTLSDLIKFNEEHRDVELPPQFPHQDKLIESNKDSNTLTEEGYTRLDTKATEAGAHNAIDRVLREHSVDVIMGPADSLLPDVLALASKASGYPAVTLPLSYLDWNGRPFGLLVVASKFQEDPHLWASTFPPRRAPTLSSV
ncbi:amidase family protein [Lophiostoma macrostomum CBS 122681]|uniref:Amidase family protein n=1 Tax=Lophiostoma macrostomum CBS 122681 TaxID=1314788 RepID=A0A6A6T6R7_9PLEO|nr:amidase family protein [Lophiostoma macrostomum CBS 122681]